MGERTPVGLIGERPSWLRRLAWLPLMVTFALWIWNLTTNPVATEESVTEWLAAFTALASVLGFAVVGFYLSYRLPGNAVGWVLAGFGISFSLSIVLESAVTSGIVSGSAREWLAWGGSWIWAISGSLLAIYLPLLFPDGRLPSKRWRWLPWGAGGAIATLVLTNAFSVESTAPVRNPLGIPELTEVLSTVGLIGFACYAGCIVAAVISVVGRFKRSQGIARRQMLMFVSSAAIVVLGIGIGYSLYESEKPDGANLANGLVSLTVPAAVGMAVLRYRLYDLGRLFKRTATYTAVAVVLLGVYWTGILALQAVLGADDSLSVAASTLAAAALFSPVRSRIQALIDRRFDRARYDAAKVVDEFSSRLSQQVDLDELNLDLAGVVGSTLRPTAVSVWVRPT